MNVKGVSPWLAESDYIKAVGQLRLQINGVLGGKNTLEQNLEEITRLAEDFGLRVRGADKIISLEKIRKGKKE